MPQPFLPRGLETLQLKVDMYRGVLNGEIAENWNELPAEGGGGASAANSSFIPSSLDWMHQADHQHLPAYIHHLSGRRPSLEQKQFSAPSALQLTGILILFSLMCIFITKIIVN